MYYCTIANHVMNRLFCGIILYPIFLQISGSLVFRDPADEDRRFKSSSAKRCFLLAIAPVKETYDNIKVLLDKLELSIPEDLTDIYAQDLKCLNIVCGLGNHRSTFPCIYCKWKNGN